MVNPDSLGILLLIFLLALACVALSLEMRHVGMCHLCLQGTESQEFPSWFQKSSPENAQSHI